MSYSSGICDCTQDTSGCLDIIICWPCQISRQCNAADPQNPQTNECSFCYAIGAYIFPSLFTCLIRRRVAERFNFDEGCCGQVIFGCICTPFSLCQTHRELSIQQSWPGGTCCQDSPPSIMN